MRNLLTISLFGISIALGIWAYLDHRQAVRDRQNGLQEMLPDTSPGLLMASLVVAGLGLGSLQGGRRRRRQQLRRGDFDLLSSRLNSHGIGEDDIEELRAALEADPPNEIVRKRFTVSGDSFSAGERVNAWIIKMLEQRAQLVGRETTEQWEQLIGTALLEYYGWD